MYHGLFDVNLVNLAFTAEKKGLWGNQYGNPTAISDANVHHIIPSSKGQLHRHRSNRGCFKRTSDTSGYMRYKPDINRITITKSPISFWQIEWYIFSKCKSRTAQPWLAILRQMRCELIWVPTALWKNLPPMTNGMPPWFHHPFAGFQKLLMFDENKQWLGNDD